MNVLTGLGTYGAATDMATIGTNITGGGVGGIIVMGIIGLIMKELGY